jgi:hypothetical protein
MGLLKRLWDAAWATDNHPRVEGLKRHVASVDEHARHCAMMRRCVDELRRSADPDLETQKAELDAMVARHARQVATFELLKSELLEDGFDVAAITLQAPDLDAAEYAADSLIAAFEIEEDLGAARLDVH